MKSRSADTGHSGAARAAISRQRETRDGRAIGREKFHVIDSHAAGDALIRKTQGGERAHGVRLQAHAHAAIVYNPGLSFGQRHAKALLRQRNRRDEADNAAANHYNAFDGPQVFPGSACHNNHHVHDPQGCEAQHRCTARRCLR